MATPEANALVVNTPIQHSLFYKDGSSDKVYHMQLKPKGNNWVVEFQYGRRHQSLQAGTKTQKPLSWVEAKKIYDKLYKEKTAKGYTLDAAGTPYQGLEDAGLVSGMVPQLLNFVDEDVVAKLLADSDYFMQEKKDGVRCMIRHANGRTEGSNRKGLIVSLPQTIEKAFEQLDTDCVLDGERIGDTFYAFDLLEQEGVDLRPESAQERHNSLYNLIGEREIPYLVFVERYDNNAIKAHAFKEFQKTRSEGVVFKERYSAYVPGRPASGGKQLKYKFYATATLRVIKINDKRSVGLGVYAGPGAVPSPVGNVTIPANHQIPKVGDLVEVRYLYAFLGGSLFQPTYLGVRTDKDEADWFTDLKLKAGDLDDEG